MTLSSVCNFASSTRVPYPHPRAPGDVRAQEEMLRRVAGMADGLDYEGLKRAVMPAVHTLCLATTSG
jgi:hypothetical protein